MTQNEKSEIFLSTWIIDDCKLLCQFGRYFRWCEFYTRRTLRAAIEPKSKSSPALCSCGWRVFAWTFVCIDLDLVAIVGANGEWNGGEEEAAVFAENVKNAFRLGETLSHSFLLWNAFRSPFLPIENHYSTVGDSCMRWILRFCFVIQPSGCLTVFPRKLFSFRSWGSPNLKLSGRRLGWLPMIRKVLPATNIQLNCFGRAPPDYGNFPAFIDCRKDDKKKYKCRKASPANRNVFRVYCP